MSEEYRGYTNYETFIVSYYLKKEHYIYQQIMNYIEENCITNKYKLYRFIEELVVNQQPLTNISMYSDILWHSLGKVNYIEVAEDFLAI